MDLWGDVPGWLQIIGTGLPYFVGRRQQRAIDWLAMLDALADVAPEDFERALRERPEVEELLIRAMEAAARTLSDEKHRSLARAVGAAVRGDRAMVEKATLFTRTLEQLETPDVQLLASLTRTLTPGGVTSLSRDDIADAVPEFGDSLDGGGCCVRDGGRLALVQPSRAQSPLFGVDRNGLRQGFPGVPQTGRSGVIEPPDGGRTPSRMLSSSPALMDVAELIYAEEMSSGHLDLL
jgi:hypothetical protein